MTKISNEKFIKLLTTEGREIFCYSKKNDDGLIEHPKFDITEFFVYLTSVDGDQWIIPIRNVEYLKVLHEDHITFDEG